jgi:hypothetical protein
MKELEQSDYFKFEGEVYQIKRDLTIDSWGKEIKRVYLINLTKELRGNKLE